MRSIFRKKTITEKRVDKMDSKAQFTESHEIINKLAETIYYPKVNLHELPPSLLNRVYHKQVQSIPYPLDMVKEIRTSGKYTLKQQYHRFILQEEDSGIASKELLHSFDTQVYDSGYVHLTIKDVYVHNVPIKLKLKLVVKYADFEHSTDYVGNQRHNDDLGVYVIKIGERANITIDVYGKFVPEEEMKSALEKFKSRKVKSQFADHLRQFSGRSQRSFVMDEEFKIGSLVLDVFACNVEKLKKTLSINISELLKTTLKDTKAEHKIDNATCDVSIHLGIMQLEQFDFVFLYLCRLEKV